MPPPARDMADMVRERDAELVKPPGALGRLEEIVAWMAAWQGKSKPTMDRPLVAIFAANHGVVAQGVSKWPQGVTRQMMETFAAGGAAVNQICATYDLGLKVFDLALDMPTGDITQEPALDERAAAATFAFGMEAIAGGIDLLCVGEMGIGNTTVAAAIHHALYGGAAADWVGRGAGVDDEGLKRKIDAVERAVALHRAHLSDPLEVDAPPWRARDLGHRGRHRRRAHRAHSGHHRRLRGDGCGRGAARDRSDAPSSIAWPGIARPKRRTAKCCAASACSRCSISACGWARAPARRWRRAS